MRIRILIIALLAALSTGCATGIRVGGDHYGAGIGGYIGPVPRHESYLLPPVAVDR